MCKTNSEEINFKLICPYQFHGMFWQNVKIEDNLRDLLVYEVFNCGRFDFTKFLSERLDMADMGFIASTSDPDYLDAWENIEGRDAPRFYLYPKDDDNNRLQDRSESEIGFIFKKIKESPRYRYTHLQMNGDSNTYSYDIYNTNNVKMFMIRPCCPYCHTLLPDMWFSDFIKSYLPIALVAGKSGGKTTYMTSLLDKHFRTILNGMGGILQWKVDMGIEYEKERFKIQQTRFENLDLLINKGQYPSPTDYVMPPVCIKITKRDPYSNTDVGQIIVSIFDCKGEMYEKLGEEAANDEELQFLNFMHSYIFLVDHFQMAGIDSFEPLMSIAEQGKFQQNNADNSIVTEDILQNRRNHSENKDEKLYKVLENLSSFLGGYDNGKDLKHIAYTIVKSDELQKFPETLSQVDGIRDLLEQNEGLYAFNPDNFAGVDFIVKRFFEKIVFNTDERSDGMDIMRSMGGRQVSKSWHCISVARPLSSERQTNGKVCEFHPVRIAEPFARCIWEEMKRLNWL